jgi:sterol desaturase/sphingolipid hydroxylase (fatty acid hydroxylase superfamily)
VILPVATSAFAGAFTWTFLEYVIHRWLGHDGRFRGNPFGVEHVRHHIEGNYFAPTWKKLLVTPVFAGILAVPATLLLGPALGIAYVAGLIGFYGLYELLHRLEHVWEGMGPYGRWARRHHFTHHFVDARYNHGVTTPLWDLVFGTYRKVDVITVPPKLAMRWLTDPATGALRPSLAGAYSLGKSR